MEKQQISDSMELYKEWYEQAEEQTIETLPKFIDKLMNGYIHDDNTLCRAIAAGGLATMYSMTKHEQGAIDLGQAQHIMWQFLWQWMFKSNRVGMKFLDYDKLLYPQFEKDFEKSIPEGVWNVLKDQAKLLLESDQPKDPELIKHLEGISKGVPPFGFRVEK